MLMSSWNRSLHAYGMRTWYILLLLQARQVNSFLFRLALAIKPHLSHTCTRYLNHKRAQKKSSHTSKLLGARESFFQGHSNIVKTNEEERVQKQ